MPLGPVMDSLVMTTVFEINSSLRRIADSLDDIDGLLKAVASEFKEKHNENRKEKGDVYETEKSILPSSGKTV